MRVNLTSLGCVKNLVDSEIMQTRLTAAGWDLTEDPAEAEVIIVNTCSFIQAASEESIDSILELAKLKQTGVCRQLIVVGCLPQRYGETIRQALPEVDLFLGTGAFETIVEAVSSQSNGCVLPNPLTAAYPENIVRTASFPYTYIKIAEGCSRHCTYCIIPKLRGPMRSRPPEKILAEAKALAASGAKEILLVAQDTTSYGFDLPSKPNLASLLEQLAEQHDRLWIRFLYGYPKTFTSDIISIISKNDNICPYFDIPIQHASDRILKRMGRNYGSADLKRLFTEIRSRLPQSTIRTTVMTGFPGETDHDAAILLDFIEQFRFDHLGVFCYSDADDLPSFRLKPKISKKIAGSRRNNIMARQMQISAEIQEKYLNQELMVLVEEPSDKGIYIGRTMFQAPEVDGLTFIQADNLLPGEFVPVRITDTLEYDLIGEPV